MKQTETRGHPSSSQQQLAVCVEGSYLMSLMKLPASQPTVHHRSNRPLPGPEDSSGARRPRSSAERGA